MKGTHGGVDGIYTADPALDPNATRLDHVSYLEVINRGLKVMDSTAITLCMDNNIPIVVFDLVGSGNLTALFEGVKIGTLVHQTSDQLANRADISQVWENSKHGGQQV